MTDKQKTLGQILTEIFFIFRSNFVKLAAVTLAVYLPLEFIILLIFKWLDIGQANNFKYLTRDQFLGYILVNLAATAVLFLYQIALFKIIESIDKKETLSLKGSYQKAFALFGSCLCVISLVILKVVLWSLLLIIPGIIFGVFYSFANLAFILDGKKGNQALVYSKQIVKPAVWRLVGNLLALLFVIIPLNLLIVFTTTALFGHNEGNYFELMPAIGGMVEGIMTAVIGSYASVFYYFLYKELKANKESAATKDS